MPEDRASLQLHALLDEYRIRTDNIRRASEAITATTGFTFTSVAAVIALSVKTDLVAQTVIILLAPAAVAVIYMIYFQQFFSIITSRKHIINVGDRVAALTGIEVFRFERTTSTHTYDPFAGKSREVRPFTLMYIIFFLSGLTLYVSLVALGVYRFSHKPFILDGIVIWCFPIAYAALAVLLAVVLASAVRQFTRPLTYEDASGERVNVDKDFEAIREALRTTSGVQQ